MDFIPLDFIPLDFIPLDSKAAHDVQDQRLVAGSTCFMLYFVSDPCLLANRCAGWTA
jgi:hypothetical protein